MARDHWCECMTCRQKDTSNKGLWVHKLTYYHHKTSESSSSEESSLYVTILFISCKFPVNFL